MGFESINTIYKRFDRELTHIENLSSENFKMEFSKLKEKYKQQILFEDSAYFLNCSGKYESFLANKNGIIKIGNDFISCKRDGVETFKTGTYSSILKTMSIDRSHNQNSNVYNKNSTISSIHPGSLPSQNSFSVYTGPLIFQERGRGKFYGKLKIYNIHTTAGGYRGFVTLEVSVQHKHGLLGYYRDVISTTATYCNSGFKGLTLTKLNSDGTMNSSVDFPFKTGNLGPVTIGQPDLPIQWNSAPNMSERYELVLMCSTYLKNNPSVLTGVGNSTVFGNVVNTINDDFLQPIGYWSSFGISSQNLGIDKLKIKAFSIGYGVFAAEIDYDMEVDLLAY